MSVSADNLDMNEEQQFTKECGKIEQYYSISMLEKRLRQNGLRPTRQRLELAHMIFLKEIVISLLKSSMRKR